jgi:PPOX class probable F420-dependent enzyme
MPLDDDVLRLAKGANLATVVTLMPDGSPQAQLTWIDAEGDHVLVNTEPQRQRYRNLQRDPRVSVLIHSHVDPWDWAEVRGTLDGETRGQARRPVGWPRSADMIGGPARPRSNARALAV